jgi:hypothetical protein
MLHAPVGKPSTEVLYGLTMAVVVYGWLSVSIYLPILPELEAHRDTTRPLAGLGEPGAYLGVSTLASIALLHRRRFAVSGGTQ